MTTAGDDKKPLTQNSVPWFWPLQLASHFATHQLEEFNRGLRTIAEATRLEHGLEPEFASPNRIALDLHTMRLRDFSRPGPRRHEIPTLIDAPYAGHTAVIADYADDQSLVRSLLDNGITRLFLTDWKSATYQMKDYDIDNYLAEMHVAVDEAGGQVNLIGLCQGGWMSAMYAARYPHKVNRLVLAGAPIDTAAGEGAIRNISHILPLADYRNLVNMGGGLFLGRFMLEAWKSSKPSHHYFQKYVDLYEHIDDPAYVKKQEAFEAWYENPINLPGRWYLQAVEELFQQNRLVKGTFTGLGKTLSLADIKCPVTLLAGEDDDITTPEQVMNAEQYLGTAAEEIVKVMVPGGHIGLFMGAHALNDYWPDIARWLQQKN